MLKQIKGLPEEMDIIGELPSDDYKFLCVIGSRTNSTYGKEVCEKLIQGLAGYPIVIVSGLALGMDSIAHEAALKVNLKTISFPGSGLAPDAIYPYSKRELAKRIVQSGGALISRFPTNALSQPWMFPVRNKLMAGVSHATLVIEGRRGSGTLGTADYATEFNRDILAVPGDIHAELSYGPHMLIRRGATPITSSQDILEALGFTDTTRYDKEDDRDRILYDITPEIKSKRSKKNPIQQKQLTMNLDALALSSEEKAIADCLKIERLSATELIYKTSLSPSTFNITISELEMKNLVKEDGGVYGLK